MQVDKYGNATLVDRDTGKDLVTGAASAREILEVATLAVDGAPRYVLKENYDGKVAKAKKGKGAEPEPEVVVEPVKTPEQVAAELS